MSINSDLIENLLGSVGDIGNKTVRATLHTMYPKEFELYMISVELTDSSDNILDYLTFPINPNSIVKSEPYIKTIDKTLNGVTVVRGTGFTPQDLTIKGSFGRAFKILVRQQETVFTALRKNPNPELSSTIKNGYGTFKVLQEICKRSNENDSKGLPNRLYFHNFPLGESYLCEVMNFEGSQDLSTNMMWNYSLTLKILAPINLTTAERFKKVALGTSQKLITSAVNKTKNVILQNVLR